MNDLKNNNKDEDDVKTNNTQTLKDDTDEIDIDLILFKIWFILNSFDKSLCDAMVSKFEINSIKSLISKSSHVIFNMVSNINWNNYKLYILNYIGNGNSNNGSNNDNDDNYNNKYIQLFYTKYDQLKNDYLLSKNNEKIKELVKEHGKEIQKLRSQIQQLQWKQRVQQQQQQQQQQQLPLLGLSRGAPLCSVSSVASLTPLGSISTHCNIYSLTTSCNSLNLNNISISNRNIGFSLGGAKDINSFRLNIKNHQIPDINSITFEGIFSEYYFNTNEKYNNENQNHNDDDIKTTGNEKNDVELKTGETSIMDKTEDLPLFYPSYSYSKSIVPLSLEQNDNNNNSNNTNQSTTDTTTNDNNYEHFLTVGLNSNIKEKDFQRKKLNLIIVLDISGSMGSTFDDDETETKIKTARECILLLLTHLNPNDRFGLILFDTTSEIEIQLDEMSSLKLSQIKKILQLESRGGTNMEVGFNEAIKMFNSKNNNNSKFINDNENYENRMIFLTDACPNDGATDANSLMKMVSDAANKVSNSNARIYTTFVGIGVDFNSNLVSTISNVRGCNYFSVDSKKKFEKKLCSEFDYFVSPMVFNLKLSLFCEGGINNGGCIERVFGDTSGSINVENGEIMKIDTLFPSPPSDKEDGAVKGGIVLIKLKPENMDNKKEYFIQTQFEDKFGKKFNHSHNIVFNVASSDNSNNNKDKDKSHYANLGVRKGLLLVRYVLLIKQWIKSNNNEKKDCYPEKLKQFKRYFEKEMKIINDNSLKQEIEILDQLIDW